MGVASYLPVESVRPHRANSWNATDLVRVQDGCQAHHPTGLMGRSSDVSGFLDHVVRENRRHDLVCLQGHIHDGALSPAAQTSVMMISSTSAGGQFGAG